MPFVSKPYNYNNGQTIDATQLDQNLDTLYNLINGLLDAVNIAANGLNDPNKFAAEVITQAKSKGLLYTQDLYGQSWVVSGGVVTASGSPANQITVTTLIANILQADGSYRHVSVAGTTYVTSIINATYFLELQPDGTMNWSQTHSVQANYMPIATVTSDASGNISVIMDNRTLDPALIRANTKNMNGFNGQSIFNGNFDVAQRGTSFLNPTNNQYTLDRWKAFFAASGATFPNVTHSQQTLTSGDIQGAYSFYRIATDGAGSGYTSSTGYQTAQLIENGTRYLCGNGKKVTVSFWARSSIANKRIGIYLFQSYGSGGSPSASENINGTNFTLTSTWTKYTFTFVTNSLLGKIFGTNKDDYLGLFFMEAWGSGNNTIVGAVSAETFIGVGNIDIAQVQVNAGDIALPFQPRSSVEELALCQKYYRKSYKLNDAPGAATTVGGLATMAYSNVRLTQGAVTYEAMRAVPTVTIYTTTGVSGSMRDVTASANRASSVTDVSEKSFYIFANSNDMVAGNVMQFHYTLESEL